MKGDSVFRLVCVFVIVWCTGNNPVLAQEAARRSEVEKWDLKKLRYATGFVTDSTKDMLKIPDYYQGKVDFVVSKKAPRIEFAPIRGLIPEFFPDDSHGYWSQWAEVTKGPNGCFYMSTGDHRVKDGHVYITEYNPEKNEQRTVVDVGKLFGWKKGQYVDGKIHGRMDIMPDGTLVAATWIGVPVTQEYLDHGWLGGYLLTYNVFTRMATSHGIPFLGDSWPYHSVDTQTGVIMAVGDLYNFMSYNVLERKLLYGGMPPDGIQWCKRATLLDEATGMLYSTDNSTKDNVLISYDQRTNRFARLACSVPPNPVTGTSSSMRAYTARRTLDGVFWCMDQQGSLFKFYPDEEKTEFVTVNWDTAGVYTTSVAISPGYRYIYYIPGSHGKSFEWGAPVVQYDIRNNSKKVIAFLHNHYHTTYGYICGGTYGIELSEDGSFLVIQMNGRFGPVSERSNFANPAIFVVHIPESERSE